MSDFEELQAIGNQLLLAVACFSAVLQTMFQTEQQPRFCAQIVFINQQGSLIENRTIALQNQIEAGHEQWVPRADQFGPRCFTDVLLFKANALVSRLQGNAQTDLLIPIQNCWRNGGDLVAALFPWECFAAQAQRLR